jgi:hypothetical protein
MRIREEKEKRTIKELEGGWGGGGHGGIMNLTRSQHTWEYLSRHSLRVSLKMFKLACIMNRLEEFSTPWCAERKFSDQSGGRRHYKDQSEDTMHLGAWLSSFTTCVQRNLSWWISCL